MWVYAYKLNFDELKTAAFKTLDENWKMHQNSSEFLEMMKSAPNAVSFFHFFLKNLILFLHLIEIVMIFVNEVPLVI